MRISDWSSDVCSSDLLLGKIPAATLDLRQGIRRFAHSGKDRVVTISHGFVQPRRRSCMLRAKFNAPKTRKVNGRTSDIVDGFVCNQKIGSASLRERVCQYVEISVGAVSLNKKHRIKI